MFFYLIIFGLQLLQAINLQRSRALKIFDRHQANLFLAVEQLI